MTIFQCNKVLKKANRDKMRKIKSRIKLAPHSSIRVEVGNCQNTSARIHLLMFNAEVLRGKILLGVGIFVGNLKIYFERLL